MLRIVATLRITESELASDVRGVLAKVQAGTEVIIEEGDHRPLAVISAPRPIGRTVSECKALAVAYERNLGQSPVPDEGMAADIEAGRSENSDTFQPPSWD